MKKRIRTSEYIHECYRRERKNNPKRFMLQRAKQRSKNYGYTFDLTVDDFDIPEICPILGIPLVVSEASTGFKIPPFNSPSLDRVDSSKGYVRGNVIVCSTKANILKNSGSAEDHRKIAEFLDKWEEQLLQT